MDSKALAKSKRAHSLHHSKKPHPSRKPKPPSAGTASDSANAKKQTAKQIREKTCQAQRVSALPSNQDRYEEEFDSASDDQSGYSASQAPDIIVPKSKGADYRHLIAEAQSQMQSNTYSDSHPSLDDVLPGSMLSVRGEGILSWIGDDNFIVEDRTTDNPEVSFLSLNLNALAEQLEKVDLPERLFIEEDLLPPELRVERSKVNSNQTADHVQTTTKGKAAAKVTEEPSLTDFPAKVNNITAQSVGHISSSSGSKSKGATLSNGGFDVGNETCGDFISSQHGKSNETRAFGSSTEDNSTSVSVSVSNKKVPTFEAVSAEAELDMLLDSFGETKLLDSSGLKHEKSSRDFNVEGSPSQPQLTRKGVDSSKSPAITSSIDDLLDDLLQEKSSTVNQGVDLSKSAAVTSNFDDLLEDLLEKTSSTVNQNDISRDEDVPDNIQSSSYSHSVLKSKVLNDFDSWLDTDCSKTSHM